MTLKIERISSNRGIRIRLSGQFRSNRLDQVKAEINRGGPVALDLEEVDLVDVEAVRFLNAREDEDISVLYCSPYIRAWMLREREEERKNMLLAGIKVPDTTLVRDAIDLSRSLLEPFLYNHVMRSWLFGILLSEGAELAPDPELLAVAAVLHDLGLTDRYMAENRFEVDGANAARAFLKDRGISAQQMQVVWDAIALHTTPTLALHKEPEVVMTHSGIAADVLGAGLDRIPQDKQRAVLTEFPRLAFKNQFQVCLCNVVRRKPATSFDNILRDFGIRYVEGFTPPSFAHLFANAPFSE